MQIPRNNRRDRYGTALALVALAVLIAASRLRTFHEPVEWDVGTYAVVARELNNGERLYADAWDMKPPAIFATYLVAEWFAGYGFGQIYLLGTAAAVVTMLGVYACGAVFGRRAGLFAALCYAIVQGDLGLEANRPNTEAFINACAAWAFALLLRAPPTNRADVGRAIAIGALIGLGSLYKHVAVAVVAPVLLSIALTSIPRRVVLTRVAIISLSFVAVWAALYAYFAATGRGEVFWKTTFDYPRFYAGNVGENLLASLAPRRLFAPIFLPLLPCAAMTLALCATKGAPPLKRAIVMLFALVIGTQVAIALPRQFFAHYYQLWLVPLSVGAGWGYLALLDSGKRRLAHAAGIVVIILLIFQQVPSYTLSADEWALRQHGVTFARWLQPAARELDSLLAPGETFYQWADEPWLYFATKRRPPAAAMWRTHTLEGPVAQWLTERTLEDLRRETPPLIVTWQGSDGPADHPIARFIRENYQPMPDPHSSRLPLIFWRRLVRPET